jgi:hypothetical protein
MGPLLGTVIGLKVEGLLVAVGFIMDGLIVGLQGERGGSNSRNCKWLEQQPGSLYLEIKTSKLLLII